MTATLAITAAMEVALSTTGLQSGGNPNPTGADTTTVSSAAPDRNDSGNSSNTGDGQFKTIADCCCCNQSGSSAIGGGRLQTIGKPTDQDGLQGTTERVLAIDFNPGQDAARISLAIDYTTDNLVTPSNLVASDFPTPRPDEPSWLALASAYR